MRAPFALSHPETSMSGIDRRSFLQSLGVLVPATALGGMAAPADAEAALPPLDDALMLALGEAVLPSELGPEGVQRVVVAFQGWLAGFQPVAELNHGYGTGELAYTAADPGPGWGAQLRALDLLARRRLGRGFAALAAEERRELVRALLARERLDRLPDVADAPHVAVGLLAYFYGTPEATDLCYRAAIRRTACRPLSDNPERPAPLQPRA